MNAPRYYLAKYIPDLRRVEPRNIGVMVWTPRGISARFLAEKPERLGEVDGRSIPSFVTSTSAYKQWIQYWRAELDRPEVESVVVPGKHISRDCPDYMQVLAEASKGNFVLAEAGFLLDQVQDVEEATEFLFTSLVDSGMQEEPRDPTLDEVCDRLIEQTNLSNDPNFHSGFEVKCKIAEDVEDRFEFSHAYKNGSIKRLYQRVPLAKRKGAQRKNIHDAAWMFERVTQSDIVSRDNAVALVYAPSEIASETDVQRWLKVLGTVSRVVNVSNENEAHHEFAGLPALAFHH